MSRLEALIGVWCLVQFCNTIRLVDVEQCKRDLPMTTIPATNAPIPKKLKAE